METFVFFLRSVAVWTRCWVSSGLLYSALSFLLLHWEENVSVLLIYIADLKL